MNKLLLTVLVSLLLTGCSITVKHVIEQDEPLRVDPLVVTGNFTLPTITGNILGQE